MVGGRFDTRILSKMRTSIIKVVEELGKAYNAKLISVTLRFHFIQPDFVTDNGIKKKTKKAGT